MGVTIHEVVVECAARYAPEELPLVEVLGHIGQDGVARRLRRPRREDQLGFGLGEITAVVTPVVWVAVDEASRTAARASVAGAWPRIATAARRLLRRSRLPAEIPPLTRDQLALVHRRVVDGATAAGLDTPSAQALADHVLVTLTLDRPTTTPPQSPPAAPPPDVQPPATLPSEGGEV